MSEPMTQAEKDEIRKACATTINAHWLEAIPASIKMAQLHVPRLLYEVARLTFELEACRRRAEEAESDLDLDGTCDTCKRGPDRSKCKRCGVGCYEWRGPCAAKSPEPGGEGE
jgi:hypothetical protein